MVKAAKEPEFQAKMKERGASVDIVGHEELRQKALLSFAAIQKYISRIRVEKKCNDAA